MTLLASKPVGRMTFPRGSHPPHRKKFAAEMAIEVLPSPKQVVIPLVQHIGAPNQAVVKSRDELSIGDVVGSSDAFVSSPVHASINGVAGRVGSVTLPSGQRVMAVPIKAGDDQPDREAIWDDMFGGDWPVEGFEEYAAEQILQAVRRAGCVGMGGAAFPTHVKLAKNDAKPIDTILVNGCECEPYLTADYRLMIEAGGPIVTGALLAARAAGAARVIIGIEDNKPEAINVMREAVVGTGVGIAVVKTKYPMGGEKQLIRAVMKRIVPTGGLPLDVGVVVLNVGTCTAIAHGVLRGKAVAHRVMTVSGAGIVNAKNLLVPIGVSYREVIDYCGGLTADAARVISGGPMMGFAMSDLDMPITKGTSGVTVLVESNLSRAEETSCVRCGRCVDVCPLGLVPTKIALGSRSGAWDVVKRYHIAACMECGCCAYGCPASIPLVQLIRMGKAMMPRD